eukprot:12253148-Ditylum_brightwellii.AAC.1
MECWSENALQTCRSIVEELVVAISVWRWVFRAFQMRQNTFHRAVMTLEDHPSLSYPPKVGIASLNMY